MPTKEEHLWRLTLSGEIRERDLRPWLCEALAERDAAREELERMKSDVAEPAEAPVAEPAAPAQEFTRMGCFFRRNGADWIRIIDGSSAHCADDMLRLLNAGLEAEQLRARVAQLERDDRLRVRDLSAALTGASISDEKIAAEKARADAAEAKLAALGENPIPRALVERWLQEVQPRHVAALVLEQILAGREPGVAS